MRWTEDLDPLAGDLLELVGYLRRSLRHRVNDRHAHERSLSGSQNELLRAVRERPGMTVGEVAAALHLATNTVSTLVSVLDGFGYLDRRRDPDDARVARLYLSPAGVDRVDVSRDRRRHVLASALADLPTSSRSALADALPALRMLVARIDDADGSHGGTGQAGVSRHAPVTRGLHKLGPP